MNNIQRAIQNSVDLLSKTVIEGTNYMHPNYPTVVFYFGEKTLAYHEELLSDLQRGWGGNTRYVRFYGVSCSSPVRITDISRNGITKEELLSQLTELLGENGVFSDMSTLLLNCYIDSSVISDEEDLKSWYSVIDELKSMIPIPFQSTLVLLLNETLQTLESSMMIRKALLSLYKDPSVAGENRHSYSSVFVLSNHFSDGSFTKVLDVEGQAFKAYNLPAYVLLLSNTRENDLYRAFTSKFVDNDSAAFTAAYGLVEKPSREITLLSLRTAVEAIESKANDIKDQPVSNETIANALGISNGRMEIGDAFFNDLRNNLPRISFIEKLPHGENQKISEEDSYDRINTVSMGCLSAFIDCNYFKIVDAEFINHRESIRSVIFDRLKNGLTSFQLKVLDENRFANDFRSNFSPEAIAKKPVNQAVDSIIHNRINNKILDLFVEVVNQLRFEAENNIKWFNELKIALLGECAVGNLRIIDNQDGVYYKNAQRYFYNETRMDEMVRSVFRAGNSVEMMMQVIDDQIRGLYESDSIYRKSYLAELRERFDNGNQMTIQQYVGEELIKGMDDKIEFHTSSGISKRILETYFINTDLNDNTITLLCNYLKDRNQSLNTDLKFFNTNRDDIIETIWFYALNESNLNS